MQTQTENVKKLVKGVQEAANTRYFVRNEKGVSPRFLVIRPVGNVAEANKLSADDRYSEIQLTETEKARIKGIHGDLCQGDILDRYAKN